MSFQDRLGAQNGLQLISLAAGLSLVTAGTSAFGYNFPLMLFGVVAHEMHSSSEPLRMFISFTAFSAIFDFLALFTAHWNGLQSIAGFVVLLLKAPMFFSCSRILVERGGEMRWPTPASLQGSFQGLGRGAGGGATGGGQQGGAAGGWTMPGGFGGAAPQAPSPPAPGNFPSTGGFRLGSEDDDAQGAPPAAPAPGRNGYSSIA